MSSCLVMGQPNAGKTTFTLNFAHYLGLRRLCITMKEPQGFHSTSSYFIHEAWNMLITEKPHETVNLQSITLSLPMGKRKKTFQLIDSCGLREGIHPQKEIRKAMSQTIQFIHRSALIFHLIDLSLNSRERGMDNQISSYASSRPVYCLLANKIDLVESRENLLLLKREYPGHPIIPISAKNKDGFRDVKIFLMKNL